jgi:glycosyltransferase involved in cell wall biosynthesis
VIPTVRRAAAPGSGLEFDEVIPHPIDEEKLRGFFLDSPRQGGRSKTAAVPLWGWVLGRMAPVVAVEVVCDGRIIRRFPVNVARPDVGGAHPDVSGAATSGFAGVIGVLGTARIELSVQAVLQGHARVPLARLRVRGCASEARSLPLVSVVITCFNQARYLPDAIESVLAQTHPRLEVVVVDDGSTDNTSEVARRYPGIQVVRQANGGLPTARNTGLRHSTGEYLVFLDADDRLKPDAVAVGVDAFREHPEAAFVTGRFRFISDDGTVLYTGQGHTVRHDCYREMLCRNCIPMCATVLFRRAVFEELGLWNPRTGAALDWDLYLRVTRRFPVWCHDAEVADYRLHGSNMSRDAVLMLRDTLAALGEQRVHVRRDASLREAYRAGRRFWRAVYGEAAIDQIARLVRDGQWSSAARRLTLLTRLHPRIISHVLRRPVA